MIKLYIKSVYRVKKDICLQVSHKKNCSRKCCKIHRKTPVLESFFIKVVGIKRVGHKYFPMKCFF